MPKEEWGAKRVCPSCSTRFYDLRRDPMTCPACGHSVSVETLKSGSSRSVVADRAKTTRTEEARPAAKPEQPAEEAAEGESDLGDDVLEDDDDDVSLDEIADVSGDEDER